MPEQYTSRLSTRLLLAAVVLALGAGAGYRVGYTRGLEVVLAEREVAESLVERLQRKHLEAYLDAMSSRSSPAK